MSNATDNRFYREKLEQPISKRGVLCDLLARLREDGGRYLLSVALTREERAAAVAPDFGGKPSKRWLTDEEYAALCTLLNNGPCAECQHLETVDLEDSNARWCTECGAFHDGTQWIYSRRLALQPSGGDPSILYDAMVYIASHPKDEHARFARERLKEYRASPPSNAATGQS